jgi:hypothetical protein
MQVFRQTLCWILVLWLGACQHGCTVRKVDWGARVGSYTYDQAISEMGPPERSAPLSDGSTVAEWIERRGLKSGYVSGGFGSYSPYHPYGGFYGGPTVITDSPDAVLRLTFDKDGKLVTWKKVLR